MTYYFYIRLQDGLPIERSVAFASEELPAVAEGWDAVWTEQEWIDYVESIPVVTTVTPETATRISDFYEMHIDSYIDFRTHLLALVETLGEGDEEQGFDNLSAAEQEFVALNGIGSKTQIDSVLSEPTKQTLDFLTNKQVIQ